MGNIEAEYVMTCVHQNSCSASPLIEEPIISEHRCVYPIKPY